MLNQKLDIKLLQKLSPQQIQLIKLLEIPTVELEQRIKKELEENPTLEEGLDTDEQPLDNEEPKEEEKEEFTLEDYIQEEDTPSYRLNANNYSKDDEKKDFGYSAGTSFYEFLYHQLSLKKLSEQEQLLGKYLIGNIDSDGYLRRELSMISDDLIFKLNIDVSEEELERILFVIQSLDPAGVGARNLQECLLIQIKKKDIKNDKINIAAAILEKHFEEFTKKHYKKLSSLYNIDNEELKEVIDEILKLNPKPGSSLESSHAKPIQHITPDFILSMEDGGLKLHLNAKNAPELHISKTYSNMLTDYSNHAHKKTQSEKDTITFIRQKIDSAKWFIEAIKQRQNTLLNTMNAILEYQKEYFLEGDLKKLKPMILKDIAEITDLDISTISRVANSKYIETHFGIFPLKSFFSEAMQTNEGEDVSSIELKECLKELIEEEDKQHPLTDEKLSHLLSKKGYKIARRTVAKYREQLGIPVGRMRKEL